MLVKPKPAKMRGVEARYAYVFNPARSPIGSLWISRQMETSRFPEIVVKRIARRECVVPEQSGNDGLGSLIQQFFPRRDSLTSLAALPRAAARPP